MPWARFEDRYPSNRKVRPLSHAAFRLDVTAVCWSSEQLTDGHIADLKDLIGVKRPEAAARELVERGRWHVPGHTCPSEKCRPITVGWLIHDYLVFNPAREQVLVEREAKAKRQARWRAKASRDDQGKFLSVDASQDASRDGSQDASRDALVDPYPPRPAPPRRKRGGDAPSASPTAGPSGASGEANGRLDGLAALQELDRQQADYEREQRQRFHAEMPDIFPSPEDA